MKKKTLSIALVLALCAIAVTGMSLAYFQDSDEASNTFTVGSVDIKLDEAPVVKGEDNKWTATQADRVQENEYALVYPGAVLPKDPTVWNIGKNDAWIRVNVTFDSLAAWRAILGQEASLMTLADAVPAGWTAVNAAGTVSGDTITYSYYYDTKLAVNANTGALFTRITVPSGATSAQMEELGNFNISVTADAIQAEGFTRADEAFAEFQ